jgi:hypothetical protein
MPKTRGKIFLCSAQAQPEIERLVAMVENSGTDVVAGPHAMIAASGSLVALVARSLPIADLYCVKRHPELTPRIAARTDVTGICRVAHGVGRPRSP